MRSVPSRPPFRVAPCRLPEWYHSGSERVDPLRWPQHGARPSVSATCRLRDRAQANRPRFRRRPTTPHLRLKPTSLSTEGAPSLAWDALFSLTHAAPLMPATHDLSPDADHLDDGRPSSIPTASSLASPAINGRSPIPPRGKHESRRAAVPPSPASCERPLRRPSTATDGFWPLPEEAPWLLCPPSFPPIRRPFRRSAGLSADPPAFPPNWTKSSRFSVFCRK